MVNPFPIFSNYDYYLDERFQKMMLSWNIYLRSNVEDDDLLTAWEELLLKDFRIHANAWLKQNKGKTAWRKDLR